VCGLIELNQEMNLLIIFSIRWLLLCFKFKTLSSSALLQNGCSGSVHAATRLKMFKRLLGNPLANLFVGINVEVGTHKLFLRPLIGNFFGWLLTGNC
jgi:hypothetical protein